jgi:DHA3 family tetracycline resistance protein-like MFS transporter
MASTGSKPRAGVLRPLGVRDFRLLWGGQMVSLLGDGIFTVALAWQVIHLSGSAAALSVVLLARSLPGLLLVPVSGVAADRLPRRTIMLAADVLRGLAVGMIAFLAASGTLQVWHLVVLSAVFGCGTAFFQPAAYSLYPDILTPELLLASNSINESGTVLARSLLGPALGGVLVAAFGTPWAFGADAISFAVSIATLLGVTVRTRPGAGSKRILQEAAEGFRYTRSVRWLWVSMVMTAFSNFFLAGPLAVALPVLVKDTLHGGPGALGVATAGIGVGGAVAMLTAGHLGMSRRPALLMYSAWAVSGLFQLGVGLSGHLWVATVFLAGLGCGLGLGNVIWFTLVQQRVARHMMGRVFSIDTMVSLGLLPLSYAVAGPVVEWIGAGPTMAVGGVVSLVLTGAALVVPGALDTDRSPPAT